MARPAADLRWRLRDETASAHAALDALVSSVDPGTRRGLADFLSMQHAALSALVPLPAAPATAAAIADLRARAAADLARLGAPEPAPAPEPAAPPHPLAIGYVVGGSRLGGAILARRWRAGTDPAAAAADAYFGAPDYLDIWRDFCEHSRQIDAASPLADRIAADARALFGLFHACAVATAGSLEEHA